MKVLQLTVHYSPNVGGVETHLSDLVTGLVKRKYQVFVLAYRPLMTKTNWKIFEKSKSLQILRIPWFPGFFYSLVKNPILEFIYLTPALFIATPFVVKEFRPQVIHAHGLIAGFIGVFWAKLFKVRVVVSTHSLYEFPQKGLYTDFAKWIFSNANSVICLSNQSMHEIEKLGVQKEKIARFTYWIDLKTFKPMNKIVVRKKLHLENKFRVLFVGRLVEIKGVKVLIKAAKKLNKNVEILIIGDGPLKEYIEKSAQKDSKINFIGKIDNKVLPQYYNASDIVIVPSIHEEGFGRVILESLACGTPVIASNRGAISEAMDNTVGELVDINTNNIIKTINHYYKNHNKVNIKARNALRFAKKRYNSENIEMITNLYK